VRAPCLGNLDTAKELLEFGILDEGARTLIDLRRCAQTPGCEDWQNCSFTVEQTWRAAEPLPARRPRQEEGPEQG
jgi:hypothetical protein